MYKKILVPWDTSKFSECSLEHVRAIATGCGVPEVVLLVVIEPLRPEITKLSEAWRQKVEKQVRSSVNDYLSALADNLKKEDIAVQTAVGLGPPADEILDYADKNQVDLIIMSTHGRAGASRWFFGSVADRVLHHSAVPVLLAAPAGCRIS